MKSSGSRLILFSRKRIVCSVTAMSEGRNTAGGRGLGVRRAEVACEPPHARRVNATSPSAANPTKLILFTSILVCSFLVGSCHPVTKLSHSPALVTTCNQCRGHVASVAATHQTNSSCYQSPGFPVAGWAAQKTGMYCPAARHYG